MGKVLEIGISKNKGDKIVSLNNVEAVKGKDQRTVIFENLAILKADTAP